MWRARRWHITFCPARMNDLKFKNGLAATQEKDHALPHERLWPVLPRSAGCGSFRRALETLILRELLSGGRRFADIHRGVPRISRNLLCQRLDTLAHIGIIERKPLACARGSEYYLTQAGREFAPVIESLGVWGYNWSSQDLRDEHLDPDFLMWVLHKLAA